MPSAYHQIVSIVEILDWMVQSSVALFFFFIFFSFFSFHFLFSCSFCSCVYEACKRPFGLYDRRHSHFCLLITVEWREKSNKQQQNINQRNVLKLVQMAVFMLFVIFMCSWYEIAAVSMPIVTVFFFIEIDQFYSTVTRQWQRTTTYVIQTIQNDHFTADEKKNCREFNIVDISILIACDLPQMWNLKHINLSVKCTYQEACSELVSFVELDSVCFLFVCKGISFPILVVWLFRKYWALQMCLIQCSTNLRTTDFHCSITVYKLTVLFQFEIVSDFRLFKYINRE